MFKNLIERFRAKEKRQKIKMTLKNALERLRMLKIAGENGQYRNKNVVSSLLF